MFLQPVSQSTVAPVIGLLVGGLLVRGAIATLLPPGFDEAYYYVYTRHLDWSYFDHPVLVALTTGLGVWLTGQVSAFTIRLGALLSFTLALVLLYQTAYQLFGEKAARLTLAIVSIAPILWLGFGVLTLPDAPLIVFWTAAMAVAAQEFSQRPYRPSYRLAGLGLLVGLACLGKYHGVALGVGLVGFCLTSRRHRSALTSPYVWIGVALFLLAIAPILYWNAQHDWISLRFQSGRAVPERGYNPLDALVTLLVGASYLFPSIGLPLWWSSLYSGVAQLRTDPFGQQLTPHQEAQRLILWISLPVMLGFTAIGGYRAILPTWTMPGCWGATVLLGYWASHWPRRWVWRWLVGSGLAIATVLLLLLSHIRLGTLQQPSRYALFGGLIPATTDASVQLIDIHQLRQGIAASDSLRTALDRVGFVFADNIFLAGQVSMAIAPLTQTPVTCVGDDLRGFAFWSQPNQWLGQDGLLFVTAQQRDRTLGHHRPYFQRLEKIADIPLQRGGTIVETVQVYRGFRLLQAYPRPYGN